MAEAVNCQVKNGEIRITPESYEQELFRWLENIQDWCISRQLWWGHRIPAYQFEIENQGGCYYWVFFIYSNLALISFIRHDVDSGRV